MDMNKQMTVDDEIAYNNYKLTADKILQLLSQIREDPSASAKRWVWELLQNAKDVPKRVGLAKESRLDGQKLSGDPT